MSEEGNEPEHENEESAPPPPDFSLSRARSEEQPGPGRPSKLLLMTPEDRQRIIRALRAGTPAKYACMAVGITRKTLDNWRKKAEEGEEPFVEFIAEVERAEGQYVVETMTIMDIDGKGLPPGKVGDVPRERGDARVLQWKLEKLHPKDFAPMQKQEHSGPDGGPIPGARLVYLPQKDAIPEPPDLPADDAEA